MNEIYIKPDFVPIDIFCRLTGMSSRKVKARIRQGLYESKRDGGNVFVNFARWENDLKSGKLDGISSTASVQIA